MRTINLNTSGHVKGKYYGSSVHAKQFHDLVHSHGGDSSIYRGGGRAHGDFFSIPKEKVEEFHKSVAKAMPHYKQGSHYTVGDSQHAEMIAIKEIGYTGQAYNTTKPIPAEQFDEASNHEHFEHVIASAKKAFYGKPSPTQVENHARTHWFNSEEAQKRFPGGKKFGRITISKGVGGHEAYGKAVKEHFEKHHMQSQHSEQQPISTNRFVDANRVSTVGTVSAPVLMREEVTTTQHSEHLGKSDSSLGKEYKQTLKKHGYSHRSTGDNFHSYSKGVHELGVHTKINARGNRFWHHSIGELVMHTGEGEGEMHKYLTKLHGKAVTSQHSERDPEDPSHDLLNHHGWTYQGHYTYTHPKMKGEYIHYHGPNFTHRTTKGKVEIPDHEALKEHLNHIHSK